MDRNALWALFEKTGNIGAYMMYHNSGKAASMAANMAANMAGALNNREAADADKNRRPDHTGSECR